jgi:hypothetical protein
MQLRYIELLRKTSVIGLLEGKGREGWEAGPISLGLLPDFFFSFNFFSPELEVDRGENPETQSSQKKRDRGPGSITHLQFPTGR